jgi:hypothetical protein
VAVRPDTAKQTKSAACRSKKCKQQAARRDANASPASARDGRADDQLTAAKNKIVCAVSSGFAQLSSLIGDQRDARTRRRPRQCR